MYAQERKSATERKSDILHACGVGGWLSAGQIAKAIRLTRTQTYKYLQELVSEGELIKWFDDDNARPRTYYKIAFNMFESEV